MYIFDYVKDNISSFEFLLTKKCNYQCTYCFVEQDDTYDMSFDMMDDIFVNYKKDDTKYKIMFFGGEPLLKKDNILMFLQKHSPSCNSYSIITNGSLLTEDFIRECSLYKNLYIQISLDGPEHVHDRFRIDKNNKGTFNSTMHGVELLKTLNYPQWGLHSTCNSFHIEYLYDILENFIKITNKEEHVFDLFTCIQIIHDCDTYNEDTLEQFRENMIKLFEKYPLLKDKMKEPRHKKHCGAGNSFFTFWNTGDITPCHRFYYTNKSTTVIGNFLNGYYNQNLVDVLNRKNIDSFHSLKNCKNCDNFYCYPCPLANYHNTEDYYITPAVYCWFKQEAYKILKQLADS